MSMYVADDDDWDESSNMKDCWGKASAPASNNNSGGGLNSSNQSQNQSSGGFNANSGSSWNEGGSQGSSRGGFNSGGRSFGNNDNSGGGGFRNNDGGSGFGGRGGSRGGFSNRGGQDNNGGGGFSGGFNRGGQDNNGGGGGFNRGGGFGGGNRSFGGNEDGQSSSGGFRGRGGGRGGGRFADDGSSSRGGGFGSNNGGGGFGGGGGGFNKGGFGSNNGNEGGGGFGEGDNNGGFRGGRGGGRGRGGGGGGRFDDEAGGGQGGFGNRDGEEEPRPAPYIPPDVSTDEKDLFSGQSNAGINFLKYDSIKVEVNGENPPAPFELFEMCDLRAVLLDNVKKASYTKPTPVQKYAIPIIKAKRDMMGCAQTGSGKTAAFLLPIMHTLLSEPVNLTVSASGAIQPQCIVLSPTRELAQQIHKEGLKFANGTILKIGLIYGGTATHHQINKIAMGCHLLVATPGRLHDLVNRGRLSFEDIRFIVLDEADRMLDMGFQQDIEKMMSNPAMPKPGEKTTVMFSATFKTDVQRIASKYLDNYLYVVVGMVGGACSDVSQEFVQAVKFEKRNKLIEILRGLEPGTRTIVFVETKRNADFLAAYLCESQLDSTSIHGDRLQPEREAALRDFRTGKRCILVATNVASRGLDIDNVNLVVNYDMPKEIDDYVHRIGRTGRVGNLGRSISFFDAQYDQDLTPQLLQILVQAEQNIPEWMQGASGGLASLSLSGGAADFRNSRGAGASAPAAPLPLAAEEEW